MGIDEQKSAKRRGMIQAATALFAKKGHHRTTVDEITKEAGVAKGTFYLYFRDKEELLKLVMQELLEKHKLAYEVLGATPCPKERLRQYIAWELKFIAENADFARLNLNALGAVDKSLIDWYLMIQEEHIEFLEVLIGEGCAQGHFKEMDGIRAARFLRGVVFMFQAGRILKPQAQGDMEGDVDFIYSTFLGGVQAD